MLWVLQSKIWIEQKISLFPSTSKAPYLTNLLVISLQTLFCSKTGLTSPSRGTEIKQSIAFDTSAIETGCLWMGIFHQHNIWSSDNDLLVSIQLYVLIFALLVLDMGIDFRILK